MLLHASKVCKAVHACTSSASGSLRTPLTTLTDVFKVTVYSWTSKKAVPATCTTCPTFFRIISNVANLDKALYPWLPSTRRDVAGQAMFAI